ncbi:pyroglutamyl-peptidase I Cysteine peptidase. MEROPS family C15 [Streptomyces misionensis]|uniref:Pyrrolidone-carboxylate peptidase n=1 Tax=Streptomyces misionensis TaxID=67331 RepID=A0A1H4LWF8_9ACTN|nr:pyroglutamyl-peptidase I [Streptomyces misionensis]SEB75190.1 pyroglutamyl-peptidase I Cysteine peptidase. MEROPS family C15 [Streptomyces misionensis]
MTRVLVTGFAPFGGETVNPSWQAASLLAGEPPAGLTVTAAELPCVFATSLGALRDAVRACAPDLVLCLGQAGGRPAVTVERVGINLDDARIPDNDGAQPVDEPVVPGGPAAYFSSLPVKACVAAVRAAGVPAAVSHTAGTFVCNHVAYGLGHLIATEFPHVRGGFVHVPWAPEQVTDGTAPALEPATVARGLRALLVAAATTPAGQDLKTTEGATH